MNDSEVVAQAQGIMKEYYGDRRIGPPGREPSALRIDGKWGTYTTFAYLNLDARTRARVDEFLKSEGVSADALGNARRMAKKSEGNEASIPQEITGGLKRYYDEGAIMAAVRGALAELNARSQLVNAGVPNPDQVLGIIAGRDILRLEAVRTKSGAYDSFSKAPNSSASGLFQFIVSTWNETIATINKLYPLLAVVLVRTSKLEVEAGVRRVGGPYDAIAACFAYAELTLKNAMALHRNRLPVTASTLYTLHQQGVRGGIAFLKGKGSLTNEAGQSAESLRVIAQAKTEASNYA